MHAFLRKFSWCSSVLALAVVFSASVLSQPAAAQDDDPPGRVARLGYMQGAVSFRPAGEDDWAGAVPNRPMTTGDQLWTDADSRAEVALGSAVIRLAPMTGFSFLSLDDHTVQIQLTSGAISFTVRRLDDEDDFEVDTPNQAFTAIEPGHYRIEASADGDYTVISVRAGAGEADGGGRSYSLRAGQRATLTGTEEVNADVESIYDPDDFDVWSQGRDHRYDYSRSAQYLSPDVVGYDDLDEYGDWRDDPSYGHVWFPNRVESGWAPYHVGHWAWIAPWGWTWVDDSPWGYAPFHYGRWVSVGGRWGWVAGPVAVRAVYAPALVVFIGGGPGGFGGNVGWFALGPREVFVPSYHVSEAYVTRVNVSSTTVNVTQVTNIYRTTIVNNTTITNVTYANRNVQGAVMAVPRAAFVSAQPVAKAAVVMSAHDIASASVSGRVAVVPTHASVMGAHAATAEHVAAPPAAVANRQVVAKKTPPPPPVPFAKQQQALAAHPGQPLARNEVQNLRPAANTAAARPMVKVAPPAKPATPNVGHPVNVPGRPGNPAPGNPAAGARPAGPPASPAPAQANRPAAPQPSNRPEPGAPAKPAAPAPNPEMNRAPAAQPNRPAPPTPAPVPERNERPPAVQPNNRPEPSAPARPAEPAARPAPAPNPEMNRAPAAQPNRPAPPTPAPVPERNERPPVVQPNNRPAEAQPNSRPEPNRPAPPPAREPAPRTPPPAAQRPEQHTPPPAAAKPAPPPKQQPKPKTPEEKKKEEEKK